MRRIALVLALPVLLLLLVMVPGAGSSPSPAVSGAAVAATVHPPVRGTVTVCTSTTACGYVFNTTAGKGWANSTVRSGSPESMALQLPGEAKASTNLSYSTYIARLTGTYTYWTVGSFLGTDVNTGHVVFGTTNTNFTITCHGHSGRGGGCTYTYTTDNGTIVVRFTNAAITSTALACSPTFTSPGAPVNCTVTVTNGWNASKVPTGTVRISDGATGTLSNKGSCLLSLGKCSFTYHSADDTCGTVTMSASFLGNSAYYRSAASIAMSVYVSGGC